MYIVLYNIIYTIIVIENRVKTLYFPKWFVKRKV